MRFFELVGVFDLDAIPGGEGDEDYNFRVEITREVGEESRFLGRLYRRESYRIQPTFPLADSQTVALPADHELFVVDDMIGADPIEGHSKAEVLEIVERKVRAVFFPEPKS